MWDWTIKKAERWRIDAFELWCWRRLLRVPWTARRSNQSILKEISPEYWLEGLMLNLKLQCFVYLTQRTNSLEKTLMLGGIESRRRRGRQDEMVGWHHWLNEHEFEQALEGGDGQRSLACCSPWGHKEADTTELSQEVDTVICVAPLESNSLYIWCLLEETLVWEFFKLTHPNLVHLSSSYSANIRDLV